MESSWWVMFGKVMIVCTALFVVVIVVASSIQDYVEPIVAKNRELQSSVDGLTNRLNYIDRRQLDLISMHSVLVKDLAKRGLIRVGQEADEPTEYNLPLNEQER